MKRTQRTAGARRSGVAAMWVLASVPALLALLVLVTEVAHLWLARIELTTACEAGALAGVMVWGRGLDDGPNRTAARFAAQSFAGANTIAGTPLVIATNDNGTGSDNQHNNNQSCSGNVLLGQYVAGNLDTTISNPIPEDGRACRVYASIQVNGLWGTYAGPWSIQAAATARYDAGSRSAKLVQVAGVQCP